MPENNCSKNNDGLRNRRPMTAASSANMDSEDAIASAATPHPSRIHDKNSSMNGYRIRPRTSIGVLKWIIHAVAVLCFVSGIILRTSQLHTGEECEMTYSWRVFLKVETAPDSMPKIATRNYGLYKFVDQRDPRYQQLLRQQKQNQQPLRRSEHCVHSSRNIVVYVPGHWGTYDQARSLGAHGIQLTRARETSRLVRETQQRILASATSNANSTETSEAFVYDVYALDFAEQGGALHGQFLRYQSDYLATVLRQLSEDCGVWAEKNKGSKPKNLMVVAHSMGGYVARKVLLEHSELPVENLITLATPHSNPLYSFDKSVVDFHRELLLGARTSERAMVSISGGLRDEMIEASVCAAGKKEFLESSPTGQFWPGVSSSFWKASDVPENQDEGNALGSWTILASQLVAKANAAARTSTSNSGETSLSHSQLLGMDHRAIVWCHQLLGEVRQILWVLMESSQGTAQERLDKVREAIGIGDGYLDYSTNLNEMKKGLVVRFGWAGAICMESSMIYNLPYLLALYSLLVGFRCARITPAHRSTSMLPVWATVLLGWIFRSDFSWLATVIVALVANAVNLALVHLIPVGFLLRRRRLEKKEHPSPLQTLRTAMVYTLAVVFVSMVGVVIACSYLPGLTNNSFVIHNWFGLLNSALYVYAIVTVYVMLIVWVGFIDSDSHGDGSFDIQLVTFVMMIVPFLVAGSLVLMVWEQQAQGSSWWTLLSLQVPVGILVWIKMNRTRIAETRRDGGDDIGATTECESSSKRQRRCRSMVIYASIFVLCCRGPGLLSRGAGYIVPNLAKILVWVGIAHSLLIGCP